MRFEVDEFFADAGVYLHEICEEKRMRFTKCRNFANEVSFFTYISLENLMRFEVDEFFADAGVLKCTPRRQINSSRFKGRKFNTKLTANYSNYLLKSTFGVALSSSEIWKYSLGEKPNMPAIHFFGNLLTSWLKTLTLSL